MYAPAVLVQEDGLTIGEVIADIPHDAAAVFLYLLMAASIILIWRGHRAARRNDAAGRSIPGSAPGRERKDA